jgi:uncharacterized membrane protein
LTFDHDVDDIVKIVEGAGVAILVLGALAVLVRSAVLWLFSRRDAGAYWYFRRHLGRVILLGLELLIVADIIRTVIVDQTLGSVAVLATIVAIRIVLSWSLDVEVDGTWPWRRGRAPERWSGEGDGAPGPTQETMSHPTGE